MQTDRLVLDGAAPSRGNECSKCRCPRLLGRTSASAALDGMSFPDSAPGHSAVGGSSSPAFLSGASHPSFTCGKRRMLAKGGYRSARSSGRPSVSSPPPATPSMHRRSWPHRFVLLVPGRGGHRSLNEYPRILAEGVGSDETRCADFRSTMGVGSRNNGCGINAPSTVPVSPPYEQDEVMRR